MTEPTSGGAAAPSDQRTRPLDEPRSSSWGPTVPTATEGLSESGAAAAASAPAGGPSTPATPASGPVRAAGASAGQGTPSPSAAGAGTSAAGSSPSSASSSAPRPAGPRVPRPASAPAAGKQRRARLKLHRIDPWSVFLLSLLVSAFLAVVLVVAAVALFVVLQAAGVPDSVNELVAEVTRSPGEADPAPLLTAGRVLTTSLVVAVVDVVLLTALATLGAVLYNLCASFTGGLEVTLAED